MDHGTYSPTIVNSDSEFEKLPLADQVAQLRRELAEAVSMMNWWMRQTSIWRTVAEAGRASA